MTKPVRLADVKADRAHAAWDVFADRVEEAWREAWPTVPHVLVLGAVRRTDLPASRPGRSAVCLHPLSLLGPGRDTWNEHRTKLLPALRGALESYMRQHRVPVRSTRMPRLRARQRK